MSKLPVCNPKGERVGEYDLADELLVYDKGLCAMHDAVVAYQAAQRAGTASTLGKGAVSGSGAKPWRQKGTGRARAGYRRSPVWRGGGVAHGPHPRKIRKRIPKKVARLAFRRAFSEKVAAGQVVILDELALEEGRTKQVAGLTAAFRKESKLLLVLDVIDQTLRRAGRNLDGVEMVTAADLCTYQVLRYPTLLVTRGGMEAMERRLQAASSGVDR